jgi:ABC-2 type transport system permease protein
VTAAARYARQFAILADVQVRSMRNDFWFVMVLQVSFSLGLVLGLGYMVPDISKETATYLTIGAATQTFVTVGLVMLPNFISEAKQDGRLEYFLTLPIGREAYVFSMLAVVAAMALPGVVVTLVLGWARYGIGYSVDPTVVVVGLLSMLSLSGVGVALAMVSPHQQVTNSFTNLIIFYVLFFAPVLVPSSQLPWVLQKTALVMPPTYAADGMRATLTHLPGTHLGESLVVMAGFAVASVVLSAVMIRRQG